ncbi:hypothetical protein C8Q74DRAFT_1256722 [Fomes fomentarius]|nr:hypothetical protein C8Q74DRAFT_1256722 [Fomes fomentarius]
MIIVHSFSPNDSTAMTDTTVEYLQIPKFSSISSSFGLVNIGGYISLILFGIFIQQTYKYFRRYSDASWLRYLVIATIMQEMNVTVIHMHLGYYYFVENFGNPLVFLREVWSLDIFPICATLLIITCNCFYVARIWLVGPLRYKIWLVATIIILMMGTMATSVASTIVAFRGITISTFPHFLWTVLAYNVMASTADVILTATLVYILHNSRTGFRSTDTMINRLIMYTISTGLLTTLLNIISFALVHIYGISNFVWLGTMMVAERLYAISMMTALNSRRFSESRGDGDNTKHSNHGPDPFGTAARAGCPSRHHSVDSDTGHLGARINVIGSNAAHEHPQVNISATDATSTLEFKHNSGNTDSV